MRLIKRGLILSIKHKTFPLTYKQENCLYLLLRGKSIKEIAKQLYISPRTAESHLEAIKYKLACHSKSQLIEKAIDSGFLYYVPIFFKKKKESSPELRNRQ